MSRGSMTRRTFLQRVGLGTASLALPSLAGPAARPEPARRRPNILVILADDLGFSDIGCYGSELDTPALDRLALGGLRFTQFYNAGHGGPTRASLLTGLYPHQAGVGRTGADLRRPGYRGRLNDSCVTLADVLKAAGYATFMAGKWHLGLDRPHWPLDHGFEAWFGLLNGACSYWRLDADSRMARDHDLFEPTEPDFYMTDAFTEQAVRFIEQHGPEQGPFFLYLAYSAPHWPLHAWPADIDKYRGRYMKGWDVARAERHVRLLLARLVSNRWMLPPRDSRVAAWRDVDRGKQENMDLRMAAYAAQIERMDRGIGRIVRKLEDSDILDDTLILFLSDNGACPDGGPWGFDRLDGEPGTRSSFASYGASWATVSNTPFRGYKAQACEGGIATPLIAHWPAGISSRGRATPSTGHTIDIMATCCDVANAAYPETAKDRPVTPLEGKSLLPVFQGRGRIGHDAICWEYEGHCAVRCNDWKLVRASNRDWALYDMAADRTETNNLAADHPERVGELAAVYDAWARRCGV
ncbi:MAG: arylsulfatase [Kiritimatiellae bacterium]|nr:arylsulfatase [Kiritimatiellia bacterium]